MPRAENKDCFCDGFIAAKFRRKRAVGKHLFQFFVVAIPKKTDGNLLYDAARLNAHKKVREIQSSAMSPKARNRKPRSKKNSKAAMSKS